MGINMDGLGKENTILQSYCMMSMIAGYEVDIRECEEHPENLIVRILGAEVYFELPKSVCVLPLQLISDGTYNSVSILQTIDQMREYTKKVR
jgi:hypothetical protein